MIATADVSLRFFHIAGRDWGRADVSVPVDVVV